jgi:hypothetical protein
MAEIKTKDRTVLRSLGLGGFFGGGAEGMVDVKDGKIVRVRPMRYGWKYKKDEVRQWKMERTAKPSSPPGNLCRGLFRWPIKNGFILPIGSNTLSNASIGTPAASVTPRTAAKVNTFGSAGMRPADTIAAEIKRIIDTYGYHAILMQGDGHGECKTINTPHGHSGTLLDRLGGFTIQVRNPDSWEGWYWGAKHVWGQGVQGNMWPAANIVNDTTETCRDGAVLGL